MKNTILIISVIILLASCKKQELVSGPVPEMTIHLTADIGPYRGWTTLLAVDVISDKICDSLKGTVTVQFDRYANASFWDRDTAIVPLINYETVSWIDTPLQYGDISQPETAKIIAVNATGAIIIW